MEHRKGMNDEKAYRARIQEIFDQIERSLSDVDPDLIECEQSSGSLTLRMADGSRCILSAQPSVRQLWLVIGIRAEGLHFNFDPTSSQWGDDKAKGIELKNYLRAYLKEATGIELSF